MKSTRNQMWAAVLALVVLFAGATTAVVVADGGDAEVHKKIIRKVVVNCEEGSSEDCEQEVRIETIGDDSQVVHLGDHKMVWVEGGHHGSHYSFGSEIAGHGGFLGVQLTDLTPELRDHFGVADDAGVMVAKVIDDSAAFRAGLMVGDIITRVAADTVGSAADLSRAIHSRAEGDTVSLDLWRDGSLETVSATLDQQEQFGHIAKQILVDCDEGDEECGIHFMGGVHRGVDIGCPDGDECDIKINCDDGECDCSVNGDSIDCDRLHAEHGHGN